MSTAPQPSPGEWVVIEERVAGGFAVVAKGIEPERAARTPANLRDYYSTITVATQRDPHALYGGGITDEQALANARLFAASKQMLDWMSYIASAARMAREHPGRTRADLLNCLESIEFRASQSIALAKAEGRP